MFCDSDEILLVFASRKRWLFDCGGKKVPHTNGANCCTVLPSTAKYSQLPFSLSQNIFYSLKWNLINVLCSRFTPALIYAVKGLNFITFKSAIYSIIQCVLDWDLDHLKPKNITEKICGTWRKLMTRTRCKIKKRTWKLNCALLWLHGIGITACSLFAYSLLVVVVVISHDQCSYLGLFSAIAGDLMTPPHER